MRASKDILGEEIYKKAKEKLGDKKIIIDDDSYVPRSRLNQVIYQKNVFSKKIEALNNQLEEIKGNIKMKEMRIKRLEDSEKKLLKENSRITDLCLLNSIKLKALKMNAKNIHVVSMLVDKTKLKILEDGKIEGLDEQLEELQNNQKDLFAEDMLISLMDIQDSVGELIQRKLMENL